MTKDVVFDQDLRARIVKNLDQHEVRESDADGFVRASVCLIVLDSDNSVHGHDEKAANFGAEQRLKLMADIPGIREDDTLTGSIEGTAGGAAVLLTRRTAKLRDHPGQWALPGGRVDGSETLLDAAIREAHEEVGLELSAAHFLGRLDDYVTRSGYIISPFVFWIEDGVEPMANPDEVGSIHRVSIRELTRSDSPRFVKIPESPDPVIQLPIGGDLIHAPTGALLYQFRAVAYEGQNVRIDHLEQPVFAWK